MVSPGGNIDHGTQPRGDGRLAEGIVSPGNDRAPGSSSEKVSPLERDGHDVSCVFGRENVVVCAVLPPNEDRAVSLERHVISEACAIATMSLRPCGAWFCAEPLLPQRTMAPLDLSAMLS